MPEERRKHPRVIYRGVIFISWKTFQGHRNHVLGRCLNVSKMSVGLALSTRIPAGAFVKVRSYGLNLDCSAIVRRTTHGTGRYVLGLELSKPLDQEVLDALDRAHSDLTVVASA